MTEWTDEWPTEPGWYWFWGQPWDNGPPQLYSIIVRLDALGSAVYVTDGHFMYEAEGAQGLWCPTIFPDLPEELL